jgi:hypothetical protein
MLIDNQGKLKKKEPVMKINVCEIQKRNTLDQPVNTLSGIKI